MTGSIQGPDTLQSMGEHQLKIQSNSPRGMYGNYSVFPVAPNLNILLGPAQHPQLFHQQSLYSYNCHPQPSVVYYQQSQFYAQPPAHQMPPHIYQRPVAPNPAANYFYPSYPPPAHKPLYSRSVYLLPQPVPVALSQQQAHKAAVPFRHSAPPAQSRPEKTTQIAPDVKADKGIATGSSRLYPDLKALGYEVESTTAQKAKPLAHPSRKTAVKPGVSEKPPPAPPPVPDSWKSVQGAASSSQTKVRPIEIKDPKQSAQRPTVNSEASTEPKASPHNLPFTADDLKKMVENIRAGKRAQSQSNSSHVTRPPNAPNSKSSAAKDVRPFSAEDLQAARKKLTGINHLPSEKKSASAEKPVSEEGTTRGSLGDALNQAIEERSKLINRVMEERRNSIAPDDDDQEDDEDWN